MTEVGVGGGKGRIVADDKLLLDLRAFVDANVGAPRFALLGKLVRNAHSMVSIRMDLQRALATMQLLIDQQQRLVADKKRGSEPSEADGLLGSSLFMTALFLYTRAVHSQGRERSTLDVRAGLTPNLRLEHDRILALRNQHFAHYESSDLWEDYHVVLVLGDERMGLSYPNQRRYLRTEDARALYNLLEHAQAPAEAAYIKASARLNLEINQLFDADEGFADMLGDYPFNPANFFSGETLAGYLAALDDEKWTFASNVRSDFKGPDNKTV